MGILRKKVEFAFAVLRLLASLVDSLYAKFLRGHVLTPMISTEYVLVLLLTSLLTTNTVKNIKWPGFIDFCLCTVCAAQCPCFWWLLSDTPRQPTSLQVKNNFMSDVFAKAILSQICTLQGCVTPAVVFLQA